MKNEDVKDTMKPETLTPEEGNDTAEIENAVPQEVKDELLEQSLSSLSGNRELQPQLAAAIGMTAEWEARNKKSIQRIKKLFGNDEARFDRWYVSEIPRIVRERENLIRYEQAQTRQAIKEQNAANRKRLEEGSKSVTITANNASIAEFAEKRHTAQSEYESEINTEEKKWQEFKALCERDEKDVAEMLSDDPELAARHKRAIDGIRDGLGEKSVEYVGRREAIQKKKDDALAAAKKAYDEQMAANRNAMRDWYRASVKRETQFQMKCGYDPDTAFTIAVSEVGKDSQSMLCALIDAGQGDFVQTFLDEIGKGDAGLKKVFRKDDKGNVLKGPNGGELFDWEWNPHGRLCMSLKQVEEVKAYLGQKIESDIRTRKLASQQTERQFDVEASRLWMAADELSMKPELDLDAMRQLMDGAKKLQEAGYDKAYQVSSHLASIVKSAERKSSRLEKEAAKLKTETDFNEELKKYNEYENTAAALAVYAPGSDGERIAVSKMVDGQNRMIILINNGISRGILPAERWGKIRDDIQLKRAREDKTAAHMALARLGIDLQNADQALTEALRDELTTRGPVMQEVAPGVDFAGHDDERDARQMRVRNANTLIYSWSDPTTGRKYAMSGEEYNDLLSVIAKWQERHVNPSPTGEFPEELKNFILATLRNSRTQKTIKTMWGFGSDDVYGINGIASVGLVEIERYFNPTTVDEKGRKVYDTKARYDRDMRALEAATLNTEMPSLETLRRIVTTQTGVE